MQGLWTELYGANSLLGGQERGADERACTDRREPYAAPPELWDPADPLLAFISLSLSRLHHPCVLHLPPDLTAPIDIYAEWIDACEEVNPLDGSPPPARAPKKRAAPTQDDLDDDEDLPDLGGGKRRKEVPVEEEEEDEEEEDLPELDMSRRQVVSDDEE